MMSFFDSSKFDINYKIEKLIFYFFPFIFLILYYFIIKNCGIIVDDWGAFDYLGSDIYHTILNWFPLFSNRPIAPVFISLTTLNFEFNFWKYHLLNLGTYFITIYIYYLIINNYFGKYSAIIFFSFLIFPSISSSIIFSPIVLFISNVSNLFCSISVYFLIKFNQSRNYFFLIFCFFLNLISFLIYENFFIIYFYFIFLISIQNNLTKNISMECLKNVLINSLSLLIPGFVALAWQKVLAPNYMEVYSRLDIQDIEHILRFILELVRCFTIDYFLITYKSLFSRVYLSDILLLIIFSVSTLFILKDFKKYEPSIILNIQKFVKNNKLNYSILLLIFAGLLFFLTGHQPMIGGYENRGMFVPWFIFSIFMSTFFMEIYFKSFNKLKIFILIICFLNMYNFIKIERNYEEVKIIQNKIIHEIIHNQAYYDKFVIGYVPYLTRYNINDEVVFSEPWDFGSAIKHMSGGKVLGGMPINDFTRDRIRITDDKVIYDNWKTFERIETKSFFYDK